MDARSWRSFYEQERAALGEGGLAGLLTRARPVDLPARGAIVFPHTKLRDSGELVAAAARAVVRSGREEVLALGVLHGARAHDGDLLRAARSGEEEARRKLRRVHGPGVPGDAGHWSEEFSLDGFRALLDVAAKLEGRRAPRLIERYPFLVGDTPHTLPGLDELRFILERGAALVATGDLIHHGETYGTPSRRRQFRSVRGTLTHAAESVTRGLTHLAEGDVKRFLHHAEGDKSDFRDPGAALSGLLGHPLEVHLVEIRLVDYAATLGVDRPAWVAASLATLAAPPPEPPSTSRTGLK